MAISKEKKNEIIAQYARQRFKLLSLLGKSTTLTNTLNNTKKTTLLTVV